MPIPTRATTAGGLSKNRHVLQARNVRAMRDSERLVKSWSGFAYRHEHDKRRAKLVYPLTTSFWPSTNRKTSATKNLS